jgi:hypothetical protein
VFSSTFYLYDLNTDPFEDLDLSSNETYLNLYLDDIQQRQTYWKSLTISKSKSPTSNQTSTWNACGRVCSWMPDVNPVVEIEQRYSDIMVTIHLQ